MRWFYCVLILLNNSFQCKSLLWSSVLSDNRYNALNSLNDSDGRRGYGRSPARGDSRGGGRMGGDRDRRDRDRDFRSKPASRSSMEAERERAVASTRWIVVQVEHQSQIPWTEFSLFTIFKYCTSSTTASILFLHYCLTFQKHERLIVTWYDGP